MPGREVIMQRCPPVTPVKFINVTEARGRAEHFSMGISGLPRAGSRKHWHQKTRKAKLGEYVFTMSGLLQGPPDVADWIWIGIVHGMSGHCIPDGCS